MKKLTQEQIDLLNKPLDPDAVKQHPTKAYLSTINSIYVTERLNQVFGVGSWSIRTDEVATVGKMVVCKTKLDIEEYGIHYECFGGNDNADIGDAHKGATTDAITKICSWLGIGAHVWKNHPNLSTSYEPQKAKAKKAKTESDHATKHESVAPTYQSVLNLQQLALVNEYNATGLFTEDMAKAIEAFDNAKQPKEFASLIDRKHYTGKMLTDAGLAEALKKAHERLNNNSK